MALGTKTQVEILLTARDEASKKMEQVAKSTQDMASKVRGMALQMTAMGTAIVASIGMAAMKLGALSGELQKMAAQTGTTTDEFQRLKYAITQNEGSAENLVMAMTMLRRQTVEAAGGGKEAQEAFVKLGVGFRNLADGSVRDTKEVLLDLADAMAQHKDDPEQMAAALEMLGMRGGRELVPLLQLGKQGIIDFMAEAKGIIPPDTLKKLDDFAHKIAGTGDEIKKVLADAIVPLLPYLTRMGEFVEKLAKKFDELSPGTKAFIGQALLMTGVLLVLVGGPLLMVSSLLTSISNISKFAGLAIAKLGTGFQGFAASVQTGFLALVKWLAIADAGARIAGLIAYDLGGITKAIGAITGSKWLQEFGGNLMEEGGKYITGGLSRLVKDAGKELMSALGGIAAEAGDMEIKTKPIKIPGIEGNAEDIINKALGGKAAPPVMDPELKKAKAEMTAEELLSEKNRLYLETIRLTKSETAYELEALRIERDAFKTHYAGKRDLIQQYEQYYTTAVNSIHEKDKAAQGEEMAKLNRGIVGITQGSTAADKLDLEAERTKFMKDYGDKKDMVDKFETYYSSKLAQINKNASMQAVKEGAEKEGIVSELNQRLITLTQGRAAGEIAALNNERTEFMRNNGAKKDMVEKFNLYYKAKLADINKTAKETNDDELATRASKMQELNQAIITMTQGRTAGEMAALNNERAAFMKDYGTRKDMVDKFDIYYKAKAAEIQKQDQANAGFNKASFGIDQYLPAIMGLQGSFSGTFKPNMNVIQLTIYADDQRVGEAIQKELNKQL